jgi:hypothetical protein
MANKAPVLMQHRRFVLHETILNLLRVANMIVFSMSQNYCLNQSTDWSFSLAG